jgi:outer membrane protein TolC
MAEYKAALGMKPDDPFPPMPNQIEFSSLDLTSEQLLETAFAQNQRLKGMEAEIRAADAGIELARKSRLPDFFLGFMGDAKTDPTLYRFPGNPGTMTLPIWRDKIAAQIAEARANKRSAEARLSVEQINLAVDFAQRTYLYREAMRNLELLDSQLLPKARQSLEIARSVYLAGQMDFFNLIDSERTLLALELDKVETSTQREVVLAELSLIVQGMSPVSAASGSGGSKMGAQPAPKKGGGSGM